MVSQILSLPPSLHSSMTSMTRRNPPGKLWSHHHFALTPSTAPPFLVSDVQMLPSGIQALPHVFCFLFPRLISCFLLLWKAYQTQRELRLAAMKTLLLHKAPHNMSPVLRSWLSPSTRDPLGCLRAQAGMPCSSHHSGFHHTELELPALLFAPTIRKVCPTSALSTSFSFSKWWLAYTGCQSLTECQHPWNSRRARIPVTRHSTSSPHVCTWVPPSAPNVRGTHPTAYTFQHIILQLN